MLVVASGTALALATTGTATDSVQDQDTTTTEEVTTTEDEETTEDDEELTDETTEDEETTTEAGGEASVSFADQVTDGERIVVESVTMSEGGFVTIHDSTLLDEDVLGSVVGVSQYLEAGTHEDVEIILGRPLTTSQSLIAMPHFDTNGNEVYDFIISTGEADGPYTADGEAVVDDAAITLEDEVTTTTEDGEDETTTEEDGDETTTEPVTTEPETTTDDEDETTTEPVTTTEDDGDDVTTEPVTTTEESVTTEPVTTTEEPVTEEPVTETPVEPELPDQLVFSIESMQIDEWSFVIGDSTEPDRTETIEDVTISDRTVEINLTEVLMDEESVEEAVQEQMTTEIDTEEVEEEAEAELEDGDVETVRVVVSDISIENVTFVLTGLQEVQEIEPEVPVPTTEEPVTTEPVTTTEEPVTTEPVTTTEEPVTTEPETTTEEPVTTEPVTTTEDDGDDETTTEPVTTEPETTTEEPVTTEPVTTTEDDGDDETPEEFESFEVTDISAPETAVAGDSITVTATVTNPNDEATSENVDFRLQGDVVDRQEVELEGGESTEVTFEIDTTGVPAGTYVHGVYSDRRGDVALIQIEEGNDTATETETEDGTEEEAEETTTEVSSALFG